MYFSVYPQQKMVCHRLLFTSFLFFILFFSIFIRSPSIFALCIHSFLLYRCDLSRCPGAVVKLFQNISQWCDWSQTRNFTQLLDICWFRCICCIKIAQFHTFKICFIIIIIFFHPYSSFDKQTP